MSERGAKLGDAGTNRSALHGTTRGFNVNGSMHTGLKCHETYDTVHQLEFCLRSRRLHEGGDMRQILKIVLTVALALGIGLLGLGIVFTDTPLTETATGRLLSGVTLFFGSGLILGLLNPEGRGWIVAGLGAWGLMLLGAMGLWLSVANPPSADYPLSLTFLAGPLSLALGGGYLGARLRRSRRSAGDRPA